MYLVPKEVRRLHQSFGTIVTDVRELPRVRFHVLGIELDSSVTANSECLSIKHSPSITSYYQVITHFGSRQQDLSNY